MGENESCAASPPLSPSGGGLFLNGLLPGEVVSVTKPLDDERWAMAEERTSQLIACIQPNKHSEKRRNDVASYVRNRIMECFPHQVEIFTFGSVPLKTYLPDGDIDLTVFSTNLNLKDSWAYLVRDMLEEEERNEKAEFHVKEVQYIQAEVKIIKCVVENIVVDISFNQIGGLCTLCFLEEVNHHINQNHLFKRSIILIKAWCYNESRILGSHHGLISTYALETLVLYIFHVFNNSFSGPLEVLYRFLEFFSKFDWQNFCISLWGPVQLPDVTAEPPRRDVEELRGSEAFLKECSRLYAVNPAAQEIQRQQSFACKHLNIIDPLRENNNLGRSVSKGNFYRIRSAFTLGARTLARLRDCPKENLVHEVNQFFMNTWERHGSGRRPDAPFRRGDPEPYHQAETVGSSSSSKRNQSAARLGAVHGARSMPSQQNNCGTEVKSKATYQTQKSWSKSYQPAQEVSSNQSASSDKLDQTAKPEIMVNNVEVGHPFAKTGSSPELPETYLEALLQSGRSRAPEAEKSLNVSTTADKIRKKNVVNSYSEHSTGVDDDNRECMPVSNNEMSERDLGPLHTIPSLQERHQIHGHEPAQINGSESAVSLVPFLLGHGMQQKNVDDFGYTFNPTRPPVPIVTLPVYNYQVGGNGTSTSDGLASHHGVDEGVKNHDPRKSADSFRGLEQSEMVASSDSARIGSSVEPTEGKSDILNGNFSSHWYSLQYGRSCQNFQYPPVLYPAHVVVPPAYLQGRLPWDGPGRPLAYTNVVNQLMTYGPQFVPVGPNRPLNIYQRNGNESPRYRSGTGTYFPDPKLSPREPRSTSGMRRGNYRHDRHEHHNDREGNGNYRHDRHEHHNDREGNGNYRHDRHEHHNDREGNWTFSHLENS